MFSELCLDIQKILKENRRLHRKVSGKDLFLCFFHVAYPFYPDINNPVLKIHDLPVRPCSIEEVPPIAVERVRGQVEKTWGMPGVEGSVSSASCGAGISPA
jgi:hypothetical protein